MSQSDRSSSADPASTLLERVSNKLLGKSDEPADEKHLSKQVTLNLLHELRTQQSKLEKENNELRQALEDSNARFSNLYNFSPLGYCAINKDGLILEANRTISTILQVAPDKLLKQPIADYILGKDQDKFQMLCQQLFGSKPSVEFTPVEKTLELRILREDETTFYSKLTVSKQLDTETSQELNVVLQDITEYKLVSEELRASEERFRDVAHISADWIWEVDSNACYTYASKSVYDLLGYRPDEILGKTPFDFMSSDEAKSVGEKFGDIVKVKASFKDLENIVLGKDGKEHVTLTSGSPILDEQGELLGYRGVDRDITRQRLIEEEVRNLAFYDTLTKLPNRRLLLDRLALSIASSKRNKRYCALMFLDLDNFKPLNDSYGHEVGDLLLINASKRLLSCVREIDTVARYGGDEFVIILEKLNSNESESKDYARAISEKIIAKLSDPYLLYETPDEDESLFRYYCTASIGIVLFIGDYFSQDSILKKADSAMYSAKKAGRNTIQFANDDEL